MKIGVKLCGFKYLSSKAMMKSTTELAMARIKRQRKKRKAVMKRMRRDIGLLLKSGEVAIARIEVEHLIREQNLMAASKIMNLFCELIVARSTIISKQRTCPGDLKEGICSLIFSAPRCSDIPELMKLRYIFKKKYGEDFVSAATELRSDCAVNRTLIQKLSVLKPSAEVKLNLMKEIAKEYEIQWDTAEAENEAPEELVLTTLSHHRGGDSFHFEDMASAAQAAAEFAQQAAAAAQAAAYLGQQLRISSNRFYDDFNISGHELEESISEYETPELDLAARVEDLEIV